jgi:hypothetical protein
MGRHTPNLSKCELTNCEPPTDQSAEQIIGRHHIVANPKREASDLREL